MAISFGELNTRFHIGCLFYQMWQDYHAGNVSMNHLRDWLPMGAIQFVPNNTECVDEYRAAFVEYCSIWLDLLEKDEGPLGGIFPLNFLDIKEIPLGQSQ